MKESKKTSTKKRAVILFGDIVAMPTNQIRELLNDLPILQNRRGEPWVNPEKAAVLIIKLREILDEERKKPKPKYVCPARDKCPYTYDACHDPTKFCRIIEDTPEHFSKIKKTEMEAKP